MTIPNSRNHISGVTDYDPGKDASHRAAMLRDGWQDGTSPVGTYVLVSLSDGREDWALVVRVYGNGTMRVRYGARSPMSDGAESPSHCWSRP